MGAADLDPSSLERVAGWLLAARRVLVITGAGVSADSGLPTYRGIGGLYEDSATEDGMPIEEALSGPMLRRRPELTWRHIAAVERACRGARPNRAHQVLAALEQRLPALWVLTQNVDGLHRAAGTRKLIEIHGTVHDLVCTGCGARRRVPDFDGLSIPPHCPQCDALVRPDVVLFGEWLPPAAYQQLELESARGFDLVISAGTTSGFPYIAAPVLAARRAGHPTVEINPGDTEVSAACTVRLRSGAAAAFDALWSLVEARLPAPG